MNIYDQINRNRRSTYIVVTFFILIFLSIGYGFDYYYNLRGPGAALPLFTGIALLVAVISSWSSYMYGDKLILASTHARPLDLTDEKELEWQNVVQEVAIAAGIPTPTTYVIDDADPNAFATGRDPQHASIAATKGLLRVLSRDELQGVAAHEMSHVKNYDIRLMLIITVLAGSIVLLSDWAARSLFRRRNGGSSGRSGGQVELVIFIIWLAAIILAPIITQMIAMCVSRKREYLADASGAELTRNPIALAGALEKIDSYKEPTKSISGGTSHLCIEDPKGRPVNSREGWAADLFATHPPIDKRIAALKEMAYAH